MHLGSSLLLCLAPAVICVASSSGAAYRDAPAPPIHSPDGGAEVSLEEAVRMALEHNPTIASAEAAVGTAAASRLAAYGSMLPTLSFTYGYYRASEARLDQTGQSFATSGYGAEIAASYDPLGSLFSSPSVVAARRTWDASSEALEDTRAKTKLAVETAYYRALAARQVVSLERDRLERQEQQLELVKARLEQGRATKMDLLRSEIDRNNAKQAVARAEYDFEASGDNLGVVIGLGRAVFPASSSRLGATKLAHTRDEVLAMAPRSSPRLRAARARTEAAESELLRARLAYLPKLSVTAALSWQGEQFPPTQSSWSVLALGTYTLFDGFRRSSDVDRASAALDAARASERDIELTILAGVAADYDRVTLAATAVEIASQTLDLSREELLAEEERFRLGRGSIIELQTAQVAAEQAALDLLRARLDYDTGIARLEAWVHTALRGHAGRNGRV